MRKLNIFKQAGLAFLVAASCLSSAHGQGTISASLTLTAQASAGGYDYNLSLANNASSTDPIQTLWLAWRPGYDFLPSQPSNITTPSGWTYSVLGGGYNYYGVDGYSIEFTAANSGDAINPNDSLSFGFTSPDSPTSLNSSSPIFPYFSTLWSYVYSGGASGPGAEPATDSAQITGIVAVPEPSTFALFALGAALGLVVRRRASQRGGAR